MRYSDMIGKQIRSIRESRGYSQEYLAEMLGISQSAYANLECGKSKLTVDRLFRICEILGIAVQDILDDQTYATEAVKKRAAASERHLPEDMKQLYEQLVIELRREVDFLRSLLRHPEEKL